jgi:hypothetical protein
MSHPDAESAPADGLDTEVTEPSTRRVSLGSPPAASSAGEPYFSRAVDPADEVFATLKARISRLWEEGASAADIQGALGSPKSSRD